MVTKLLDPRLAPDGAATIRRITGDGVHWRVMVETWDAPGECLGRLVFEPEGRGAPAEARVGPPGLRASSRAELLAAAYELSERRLRELLRSLA